MGSTNFTSFIKVTYLLNYKLPHKISLVMKVGPTCIYFITFFKCGTC